MNWYTRTKIASENNEPNMDPKEIRLRETGEYVLVVDKQHIKRKNFEVTYAIGANGKYYETHPKGNWREIKNSERLMEAQEILGVENLYIYHGIKTESSRSFLKTANELKRTSRKTLERLGVPFKEEIVGWREYKGKYSPIKRLIVRDEDIGPYREWQEKTKEKRERSSKRQKEKKKEEKEKAAKEIGCLMDSKCLEWYLSGKIDMQEAKRIANITEHRHESTEYEYLLDLGWSKEDAREYIRNNP